MSYYHWIVSKSRYNSTNQWDYKKSPVFMVPPDYFLESICRMCSFSHATVGWFESHYTELDPVIRINTSGYGIWTAVYSLTHWGRVTHICVGKLTIIGSDNGLSPERCQAIIWTNAGILLIRPLGKNLSEILIAIFIFSFKKTHFENVVWKLRPFCLGLSELIRGRMSIIR